MSNEHIPTFCRDSDAGPYAYKNSYDLGKTRLLGDEPQTKDSKRREIVDRAIFRATGVAPDRLYFGAVELNGCGVRFYGDYCLVMREACQTEWVLDRNSYDIARAPLASFTNGLLNESRMVDSLRAISGKWKDDLSHMLVIKTFGSVSATTRRLTVGQISNAVLNDEDYVEVLRNGSFNLNDIEEVRTSAAEVAREHAIGERARLGITPTVAELQWRNRRIESERLLKTRGIPVRVVTTSGRIK
jgi:hypothetical protein